MLLAQDSGHGKDNDELAEYLGRVADLGLARRPALGALSALRVVQESEVRGIAAWLDLMATCLAEASGRSIGSDGEEGVWGLDVESGRDLGIPVEDRVSREIGRYVTLPPRGGRLSCGCRPAVIERVGIFLDRHYNLSLSTQQVALALGFEPSYFTKMYKRFAGESMMQRVHRLRLQRARELLKNPYISIAEISSRVGFSDTSYFTRIFRKDSGLTPMRYRRLMTDLS